MPADTVGHLEALLKECETPPMVNQIECHTKSAQRELVSYCQERSIAITAYSPISGADLEAPTLTAIAGKHGVSPAAVCLRWLLQRGLSVVPSSSSPARIDANLRLPDGFVLSDSEMEELFGLDEGGGAWQQIH